MKEIYSWNSVGFISKQKMAFYFFFGDAQTRIFTSSHSLKV